MAAASIVIEILARTGSFQTDTARAERSLKSLQNQIGATRRVSEGFGDSFGNVGRELKSIAAIGAGGFGLATITAVADSYAKFTAQLKLATNDALAFQSAYGEVVRIATQSQSGIEAVGTLYARLSRNLKDVGITSKQLSDTTESVALSLRVSGATAKETASVLLQLSQSFGSGRLNNQEFAAVSEAAPLLLQQLAKSINVPIGALKDLAAEGKLTREVMLQAFTDEEYLNGLRAQVKEVQTVSSAITVLKNNFTLFIGESDKANGASKTLATGILALSENLNFLATGALVLVTAQIGRYVGGKFALISAISQTIASEQAEVLSKQRLLATEVVAARARLSSISGIEIQNIALANNASLTTLAATRKIGLIQAETALASATVASTASINLFGRAIGFLGGPVGALVTTLGLGALAFFSFGNGAETATEKLARLQRQAKESVNPFAIDLENAVAQYNKTYSRFEKIKKLEPAGLGIGVAITEAKANFNVAKKILDDTLKAYKEYEKSLSNVNINPTATTNIQVDQNYLANLQEQIVLLNKINPLLKQGVEIDDATFIAKSKLAGINDELIVTYLNLKNEQGNIVKQFENEKKVLDELNKIRNEEIPLLKLTSSLVAQGVELSDAEAIAKLRIKGVSDELIVTYLNTVNTQKELIKTQKEINDRQDEAKKLNEDALNPLEKLASAYEKLNKLQANGLGQDAFNKGLTDAISEYENATAGAFQYSNVLDELNNLYEEGSKAGFDVKEINLELTASYKDLVAQLRDGVISQDEFIISSQGLLRATDEQSKRIKELSDIINQTDTAQLEEQRDKIKLLYEEYEKGTNEALNSIEELGEAVNVVLGRQNVEVEKSTDFLEAAFKRAAENAQDAFADFLFDPFKDGLDGMLLNFVNVLKRMAAEALAAEIFKNIFNSTGSANGTDLLSGIGGFFKGIFGGGRASGGDVLAGRSYLVGERGPEMFTPRTTGNITPNQSLTQSSPTVNLKAINVLDPTLVGQYLNTDAGEKVVINIMQRNRSALGF